MRFFARKPKFLAPLKILDFFAFETKIILKLFSRAIASYANQGVAPGIFRQGG